MPFRSCTWHAAQVNLFYSSAAEGQQQQYDEHGGQVVAPPGLPEALPGALPSPAAQLQRPLPSSTGDLGAVLHSALSWPSGPLPLSGSGFLAGGDSDGGGGSGYDRAHLPPQPQQPPAPLQRQQSLPLQQWPAQQHVRDRSRRQQPEAEAQPQLPLSLPTTPRTPLQPPLPQVHPQLRSVPLAVLDTHKPGYGVRAPRKESRD